MRALGVYVSWPERFELMVWCSATAPQVAKLDRLQDSDPIFCVKFRCFYFRSAGYLVKEPVEKDEEKTMMI